VSDTSPLGFLFCFCLCVGVFVCL